jgi:hypothetical protein
MCRRYRAHQGCSAVDTRDCNNGTSGRDGFITGHCGDCHSIQRNHARLSGHRSAADGFPRAPAPARHTMCRKPPSWPPGRFSRQIMHGPTSRCLARRIGLGCGDDARRNIGFERRNARRSSRRHHQSRSVPDSARQHRSPPEPPRPSLRIPEISVRARAASPRDEFARETVLWIGTVNLALLITSSFVYSSGLAFMEAGDTRRLIQCCVATMAIGSLFLMLKFYEWHIDFSEHLFPAGPFKIADAGGAKMFWSFYFVATALHAMHMIVGVGLVGWIALQARAAALSPTAG